MNLITFAAGFDLGMVVAAGCVFAAATTSRRRSATRTATTNHRWKGTS